MRLAIIVTEFPKVTETFILRDLVQFLHQGHEVRVYHLKPYRRAEVVHNFAEPVLPCARYHSYLFSRPVLGALWRAIVRPRKLVSAFAQISRAFRREPMMWLKSLVLLPKSLAAAEDLLAWEADHVHAEFAGHPATSAWLIARFSGLPYSVSCRAHDIFITQSLLSVKLREAAFIRTVSHYNERFLRKEVDDLEGKEIHVIHSSLDLRQIEALEAPARSPFRVLFVGSHHRRKGIDVLLRALSEVADSLGEWRCRIVGRGPETGRLRKLSHELGLDSQVDFAGALPFESVLDELALCNVLVAPSTVDPQGSTEGIPNVAIEALASCRPVIATSVSGIPELVEDGKSGLLVPPGDVTALSMAILETYQDQEGAYAMATRGRELVEREFEVTRSAERQLALFSAHRAVRNDV